MVTLLQTIPLNMAPESDIPPGVLYKNRFRNVLPNAHTRVPLPLLYSEPHSDFINANFVRVSTGMRCHHANSVFFIFFIVFFHEFVASTVQCTASNLYTVCCMADSRLSVTAHCTHSVLDWQTAGPQ